jgi:dolichol-phosphate mannosyltransferase
VTALALVIAMLQVVLAARVLARMVRTARGTPITATAEPGRDTIAIVVPALNEARRIGPCLEGATAAGHEVTDVIVVDGGSSDDTANIVGLHAAHDPRVRLVEAGPPPPGWTGKVWNLAVGLGQVPVTVEWLLCLDADVRPDPLLARSLAAHAHRSGEAALSVATRQRLSGAPEGLVHPACLATLVYRFGIPGHATRDVARVQANGQCFFVRRALLEGSRALEVARASLCEDVTVARALASAGVAVGFHEAGALASVAMYDGWRDAWTNWPRSLPMRDQFFDWRGWLGLGELLGVQALPLPVVLTAWVLGFGGPLVVVNGVLLAVRVGMLAGMARAYARPPWTYWLSPLADVPVVLRVVANALRRTQRWRGLTYRRDGVGRFRLVPG